MRNAGRYRKAIVAALGAAAVIGAELPADAPSWLSGTLAVLSALGVWAVRNAPAVRSRGDLIDHLPPPTRVATEEERPRLRRKPPPYDTP